RGVEVDADDAQVDLDPLLPEALGDLAQVAAARLDAVGDQDDDLAAAGREVGGGALERQRDGRGAQRLGLAHGLEERRAVDAVHGHDEVRVLTGARVAGPHVRAVDPEADVQALVLRQRGDELGQHVLGRDDAVAAVLELVPHRARGVEDELDVDGLLGLREGRAEQAERQEGALQDLERSGHRSRLHGAADGPRACRPRTLRQTRGRASWPNPPARERVPGGAPAEPRAARDALPQEASYALRRRRLSMSSRTRRPVSQWRFSIAVATRRRGTGVGFPSSPSATKFRWPIVHSRRSPVSGFSPCTSQRTIMLVVPVHATRLLTSTISPTW